MPAVTRGVVAAVRRDLQKLPEEFRDGTEVAVALELARTIDQGLMVAQCSKELRQVMAAIRLRAAPKAAAPEEQEQGETPRREAGIADLTARIAAARRGASSG